MPEGNTNHNLEGEIAELSRQIEEKRRLLEEEKGLMVEDREALAEVIKDHLTTPVEQAQVSGNAPAPVTAAKDNDSDGDNYLDSLDETSTEAINSLIAKLPEIGLKKTLDLAREMNPFYLDALHDVLTERLYSELVAGGYLNKS